MVLSTVFQSNQRIHSWNRGIIRGMTMNCFLFALLPLLILLTDQVCRNRLTVTMCMGQPKSSGIQVLMLQKIDKALRWQSSCHCCGCCWIASVVSDSSDPIDGSPPGSPIPGILQARTLEWVAIAFSNAWKWKVKVTSAHQAPPSLGFSRQEHWSGLPFPSPMHESEKWKWLQPTRLLRPWDFLGKSTGVGCLLRVVTKSMKKKKKNLHVTQSKRSTYERLILRSRHFEGDDEDATRPKGGTVIRTSWPAPHADFPEVLDWGREHLPWARHSTTGAKSPGSASDLLPSVLQSHHLCSGGADKNTAAGY